MKTVKHNLWEVFKDDFMPSIPWRVQGPKGRVEFRLKRDAVAFAEANKKLEIMLLTRF